MNKKSVLLSILTVLCLAATVTLWFAMNNDNPEYEEVTAKVVSSESGYRKIAGSRQAYYDVEVEYLGKTYDLKNVYGSASYVPGREVTVYSARGNLYANEAGVKSTTPVATVYFIFLFGTIILLIYTLTYMSRQRQKNKEAK